MLYPFTTGVQGAPLVAAKADANNIEVSLNQ